MADVSTQEHSTITELGRLLAGKYLTFLLGEEEYGVQILKVQEIIRMQKVTRVPRAPEFVRGVINLRGRVIPVVELRVKFGMERHDDTDKTCIIVAQVGDGAQSVTMGVLIDEVREVIDIEADAIDPPPEFGASVDTAFVLGIGKMGEDVKILLDVERVLAFGELEAVRDAAEPQDPGEREDGEHAELRQSDGAGEQPSESGDTTAQTRPDSDEQQGGDTDDEVEATESAESQEGEMPESDTGEREAEQTDEQAGNESR